jgi:purine-binding chemotaxis protein CheW
MWGVIDLRGVVPPVVDMRARFGLGEGGDADRRRILVLQLRGMRTGFVVDTLTEVLRLPVGAIEDAPELSDTQRRLIGRVANLEGGARIIQILDAAALLEADADVAESADAA